LTRYAGLTYFMAETDSYHKEDYFEELINAVARTFMNKCSEIMRVEVFLYYLLMSLSESEYEIIKLFFKINFELDVCITGYDIVSVKKKLSILQKNTEEVLVRLQTLINRVPNSYQGVNEFVCGAINLLRKKLDQLIQCKS
jgi:hypothetical protein